MELGSHGDLPSSALSSPVLDVVAIVCGRKPEHWADCTTDNLLMLFPFVLLQVPSKQSASEHPEGSSISRTLDGSPRRPERQPGTSVISYDYSEEELMASIEQEYCR
ncbi:Cys1 [Vulpes lagopus]